MRKKSRFAQDFRFFGNNPKQRDRGKRELRDPGGHGTKWGQLTYEGRGHMVGIGNIGHMGGMGCRGNKRGDSGGQKAIERK